jgi:RHS repeat-associated protein
VFYVPGESGVALQVTYEEATGAERRDVVAEDALGTVSGVIDAAGVVSEKRYYDPYGKKVLADGAAAPTNGPVSDLRRGFTGHEEDAESGLTNMRGRMYDPGQRRFVTPDPFVSDPFFGQGLNRYAYVTNNPLRWVDPSGFTATKMGEEGVASSSTSADGILYFADDNLRGNAPDGGAPSEEGAAKSNPPSTQKADAAKTTTPTGPAKASPVKSTEEGPPIGPPRPPEPPTAAPPTYVGPSGKGWTIQPESGRDRRQRYADGVDKVVKNYVPLVFSAANPLSAVKALLHVTSGHEEPIVDAAIDVVPVIVGAGVSSLSPAAAEKLLSDALRGGNAGTLRGINRFGGVVSSTGNTAGGVVVTAEGSVQGVDFAGHVNAGLMRGGPVNILSGVHGSEAGIMTADAAIFAEDVAMFGRMEGVTIHDTASLSAAEVGGMLNGPGTTIGAFCNSGACLAPFR